MDFRKFGSTYVLRLDTGEEIMAALKAFCAEHNITLGSLTGIGTTTHAQIGLLDTSSKTYHPRIYQGDMEITSLMGTISQMDGQSYLHLHITLALPSLEAVGGHLDFAYVGAVAEIFIHSLEGRVDRKYSEQAGVNLLQF
jgi:predicted DNA-binding protein with PD1-like motif